MLALAFLATTWITVKCPPPALGQTQAQTQQQAPKPARPDFSGSWVLLTTSQPGPSVVREMVVTHSVAKGTLTAARRMGGPAYTDNYTMGTTGGSLVQGQRGLMTKNLRVMAWEDKVLVITEITSINRDQDSGREERWSMDDKGQLLTVITVWSPGNEPNTISTLYKRK
jgi:hypothetical protein